MSMHDELMSKINEILEEGVKKTSKKVIKEEDEVTETPVSDETSDIEDVNEIPSDDVEEEETEEGADEEGAEEETLVDYVSTVEGVLSPEQKEEIKMFIQSKVEGTEEEEGEESDEEGSEEPMELPSSEETVEVDTTEEM